MISKLNIIYNKKKNKLAQCSNIFLIGKMSLGVMFLWRNVMVPLKMTMTSWLQLQWFSHLWLLLTSPVVLSHSDEWNSIEWRFIERHSEELVSRMIFSITSVTGMVLNRMTFSITSARKIILKRMTFSKMTIKGITFRRMTNMRIKFNRMTFN